MSALKRSTATTAKAQTTERAPLKVVETLGYIALNNVTPKINSNKKEFIATPFGAVYMRIKEIKAGHPYKVVKFDNGSLALNELNGPLDTLAFINSIKHDNPSLTAQDIRDTFGI